MLAAFENASSRAASKPALCARTSCAAFSTSFVSFSSLSVSARLVESSRTSNCSALTGLPWRIGNVCTPACTAPHAEAERLGERLELVDDRAVLRLELRARAASARA